MAEQMNWTADQQRAIERKGGSVIVSAAAGSGKTAVLVERVIRLMTDETNPMSPERLLIVTFTRAAASEMKYKIKAALKERAKESKSAASALLSIDRAVISTMDSFCIRLVRENFEAVGLSPDFRTMDDAELSSAESAAMTELLEEAYASGSDDFHALIENFIQNRDDRQLAKIIGQLYHYSMSYPDPGAWLESVINTYSRAEEPLHTPWGAYIYQYISRVTENCAKAMENAIEFAESDAELAEKYAPAVYADAERLREGMQTISEDGSWVSLRQVTKDLSSLSSIKGYRGKNAVAAAEAVKSIRARVKESMAKCSNLTNFSEEDFSADLLALRPIVAELIRMVIRYGELLLLRKKQKNSYYYDDMLHFALELMYDPNGEKTVLCRKLAQTYDAVLIDEYQDTTRAQDALFSAISDDGRNLFAVGDVKQSIYGFRLATPDVFIEKCRNSVVSEEAVFPSRIILGQNFRSRAGILDFVNFVFKQIMSDIAGGVDYNEEEYLYYGGKEPAGTDDVDLLITENADVTIEDEYENIARYINETVLGSKEITVKGESRKIRYGDFCVLLRATKEKAEALADVLFRHNIPVSYEKENNYFSFPETRVLSAVLNVVDNPLNDVDLLSVMFFPLFGFIPDELAQIRVCSDGNLYNCVKVCSEKTDSPLVKKCRNFLRVLSELRNDSRSMKTSDFVRHVIFDTDFASMVASMPNGDLRLSNLESFVGYATAYEQSGAIGYPGFVRYFNRIAQTGQSVKTVDTKGDIENAVTIMSIHKSKGLEFPYVILADVCKRFNQSDSYAPLLTDVDFGIAMRLQDRSSLQRYETLPYTAIKLAKSNKMISEELRILYVAMTRASVKLVISARMKNAAKEIAKIAAKLPASGVPDPYAILQENNYWQLLLLALLRHEDCRVLHDIAGTDCDILPASCRIHVDLTQVKAPATTEPENNAEKRSFSRKPFTPEQFDTIRRQIEYRYAHAALQGIPSKVTASGFQNGKKSYEKTVLRKPSFVAADTLGGAARGTAYHKFLQHCDFSLAVENVSDEIDRLNSIGLLSDAECNMLHADKIRAFFSSDVGKEILHAKKIYREFPFRIMLPVRELYSIETDEKILVQGVADLIYITDNKAVVLDYKTDMRSDDEYLRAHYTPQLLIYKKAIEEILDIKITEAVLYSVSAEKEIKI